MMQMSLVVRADRNVVTRGLATVSDFEIGGAAGPLRPEEPFDLMLSSSRNARSICHDSPIKPKISGPVSGHLLRGRTLRKWMKFPCQKQTFVFGL
jgi:hypothetical protein